MLLSASLLFGTPSLLEHSARGADNHVLGCGGKLKSRRSRSIFFTLARPRKPPFHGVPNADFEMVAWLPSENAHREGGIAYERRDMLIARSCGVELDFAGHIHRCADNRGELAHARTPTGADMINRTAS
jgi:hypothetical protein